MDDRLGNVDQTYLVQALGKQEQKSNNTVENNRVGVKVLSLFRKLGLNKAVHHPHPPPMAVLFRLVLGAITKLK